MIIFLLIAFFIIWFTIIFISYSIIHNGSNIIENYTYRPDIKVGDIVKLVNVKNTESPDVMNKYFQVTNVIDDIVFLKSDNNLMITRDINKVKKIYSLNK